MKDELKKICRKCGDEKPHSEFSRTTNPSKGDRFGLRSRCKPCSAKDSLAYNNRNPERTRANRKAFHLRNLEEQRAKARAWVAENKETHRENNKRWTKLNLAYLARKVNERRFRKEQATPQWLTPIQSAQISEFYEIAQARRIQTGVDHEVDHIVPLTHEAVTGLHVPWNLQVITGFENASKKNRFTVA